MPLKLPLLPAFPSLHAGALLVLASLLASCFSSSQREQNASDLPHFYIEASHAEIRTNRTASVQLPASGSVIAIKPVPSIPAFDIDSVKLVPDEMGSTLRFQVNPRMRLQLMRLTADSLGKRLVLVVGQQPVGATRIHRVIEDGTITLFVEWPDDALPAAVERINRALQTSGRL
jgi:hypothetical protein